MKAESRKRKAEPGRPDYCHFLKVRLPLGCPVAREIRGQIEFRRQGKLGEILRTRRAPGTEKSRVQR